MPVFLRDLATVYCLAEKVRNNQTGGTRPRVDKREIDLLEQSITDMEFDILCAIGFGVDIELPNTFIA